MKATLSGIAALLLVVAVGSMAQADPYPYYYPTQAQAPDATGMGYFCTNYCGCVYGPNYCVRPPWEPFNGFRPCLNSGQGAAGFPTHPFARGPRDYFMVD